MVTYGCGHLAQGIVSGPSSYVITTTVLVMLFAHLLTDVSSLNFTSEGVGLVFYIYLYWTVKAVTW